MLTFTLRFVARIKANPVSFPLFEFNPNEPGVDKVEMEANGDEIQSTVYLLAAATREIGVALATKVNTAALNRITFFHDTTIESARCIDDLQPVFGGTAPFVRGIPAADLRAELEQVSPHGEANFGLFRSARQSMSPVEEFMNLYHVLLLIYHDNQSKVDQFIVAEDSAVPQTLQPLKHPGKKPRMETIYTRLRNELAHKRPGVNLDDTKAEIAKRLGGLVALTKRAIELHS